MNQNQITPVENILNWREFLTDHPVGMRKHVKGAARDNPRDIYLLTIAVPDLPLQCDPECQSFCKGSVIRTEKIFAGIGENTAPKSRTPCDALLWYSCDSCGKPIKSYVVRFWTNEEVQKLAEWPPFAPPTPAKVMTLIGSDRTLFIKGRRAEIEGLGVGAFAYYRRIIENQKNRLLDEIIRVASHLGTQDETIDKLKAAKTETQFSKAVDSIKDAIPDVLRIKGHNPLTLLHSALSEGLHEYSDEACLQLANDIRLILFEFAEKLTEAMKDRTALSDALSRLLNPTR